MRASSSPPDKSAATRFVRLIRLARGRRASHTAGIGDGHDDPQQGLGNRKVDRDFTLFP